ncbi:arsenite efflux transporter metallochaperone ArsD [Anaerocolumna sedimenticola]|uniref:Arsenite efflux transporter metallochaperone ArsD n=1 Tax=Anaerocolumna sedimenticola TaxID=2696063 RepID=A0A6P1TS82_9FIRM|nr:arsenite efflux transporter metallochaperone ArsD [Anaerocolumna sedimenticola]QHQ62288.1 arsenite efflux transporter metallochaperone ArsD [Anaerocolumna sedimenticola]
MKKMQIFEPAMCCPTGLCGVGVNPELMRISTILNTLKKNGINIDRYNLTNTPQEFVNNKLVNNCLKEKGVESLPIIVLNDEIVITGRYPTNDEFVKLLNIPKIYIGVKPNLMNAKIKKTRGCSCSGGDC